MNLEDGVTVKESHPAEAKISPGLLALKGVLSGSSSANVVPSVPRRFQVSSSVHVVARSEGVNAFYGLTIHAGNGSLVIEPLTQEAIGKMVVLDGLLFPIGILPVPDITPSAGVLIPSKQLGVFMPENSNRVYLRGEERDTHPFFKANMSPIASSVGWLQGQAFEYVLTQKMRHFIVTCRNDGLRDTTRPWYIQPGRFRNLYPARSARSFFHHFVCFKLKAAAH